MCWGTHNAKQNEWFQQRDAVALRETEQRCAYCAAGMCQYGAGCIGQTSMHPAGAVGEIALQRAQPTELDSQDDDAKKLVLKNRSRRRPHRRGRCRGRRGGRARANVHVQPATQAIQDDQAVLQGAAAQEVTAAYKSADQKIAAQLEANLRGARLMAQGHQAAIESSAPGVRAIPTQVEATTQANAMEDGHSAHWLSLVSAQRIVRA